MARRAAVVLGLGAALAALATCGRGATSHSSASPPGGRPGTVQVWLTTGDRTKLLSHEPDARLRADTAPAALVIDVDTTRRYQEMLGFGAAITDASAYLIRRGMSGEQREALLQDLFSPTSGIGLSFVRVPMGASDFSLRHYSYDDMPRGETDPGLAHFSIAADRADKLPVLQRALAINPRLSITASPWSAPGWMKSTGSLVRGTLRPEFYDAFAEYFVRFLRAYRGEGVAVRAVTLQNEPHFEPADYPGMRLEPLQRARLISKHVGPRFASAGLATEIWDWDHNWDEPRSPMAVLGDSAARRYVRGVAWHCYAGDVSAQNTVHDAFPDVDTYFTECSGGEWDPDWAKNLDWFAGKLIIGSTRNWARAVALWNLALDERFGPHRGGCGNCRGVVTISSSTGRYTRNAEYYALAHASRFVRPGARRVASSSGIDGVASVAFRNADDGSVALIVFNSAPRPRTFSVRLGRTSFRYTLPAVSVATFIWS